MRLPHRLTLLCGFAVLLLTLSVAINLALTKELYDSFAKLHFARIFPLGYVPMDHSGSRGSMSNISISFWGDSRAFFWEKSSLASTLTVHDYAHGGITSSQLVLQLQSQSRVLTDFAVVQIGINDLHPLGVLGEHKQQILDRLRQNILTIRDALLARSKVVVLTTLIPPGRVSLSRRFAWDPATLQYIDEVNEVIRRATDGRRVLLLDAHLLLTDSSSYLGNRFIDSDFYLHVNRDAYSRLNERLRQLIAKNLQPPRN